MKYHKVENHWWQSNTDRTCVRCRRVVKAYSQHKCLYQVVDARWFAGVLAGWLQWLPVLIIQWTQALLVQPFTKKDLRPYD